MIRAAFTRDGGYDGMQRLIERGLGDIELVFAANDVMAVGALSAIRDAGLTPGTDVAVAGFDDIPTVRDVTPALTTVRVPLEELGRRALRLALGDADAAAEGAVRTEVVLRESTPRPRLTPPARSSSFALRTACPRRHAHGIRPAAARPRHPPRRQHNPWHPPACGQHSLCRA